MTTTTTNNDIYITNLQLIQEDGNMLIFAPCLHNGVLVLGTYFIIPLSDVKSSEYIPACTTTLKGIIDNHYKDKPKK